MSLPENSDILLIEILSLFNMITKIMLGSDI